MLAPLATEYSSRNLKSGRQQSQIPMTTLHPSSGTAGCHVAPGHKRRAGVALASHQPHQQSLPISLNHNMLRRSLSGGAHPWVLAPPLASCMQHQQPVTQPPPLGLQPKSWLRHGRQSRKAFQVAYSSRDNSSNPQTTSSLDGVEVRDWQQPTNKHDNEDSWSSRPGTATTVTDKDEHAGNGNGAPGQQQQREQETELEALSTIPVKEQSYEGLAAWVGAAMAFGAGIWYIQGPEKAQEYFAGYLLEQSLSVDNLFVFILVFNYFKTPPEAQGKVLSWGIGTAMVLRAVFILAGVELIEKFEPLLAIFAAILLFSSYKILAAGDEDDEDEDLSDNAVVKFCRNFIKSTDYYDGDKFWTTLSTGARVATPLLMTLAVVELSDVLFAVDSIPAVFGVTLDPFIIYTSNIFAIVSLRALYGFVSNIMSELRFLDKAVAVVLGFIGAKMLLAFADINVPTDMSLLIVGVVLGAGVSASLLLPEPAEAE